MRVVAHQSQRQIGSYAPGATPQRDSLLACGLLDDSDRHTGRLSDVERRGHHPRGANGRHDRDQEVLCTLDRHAGFDGGADFARCDGPSVDCGECRKPSKNEFVGCKTLALTRHRLAGNPGKAGVKDIIASMVSIFAVGLGVLCGTLVRTRADATSERVLTRLRPRKSR
jgi:hypothetical protein